MARALEHPRLLSVNVSLPRDVTWRGQTVRTAIFKEPVDGRRTVRRLNVEGDGQADLEAHGGEHRAVFVYDEESVRHWAAELDRGDLAPGCFGENFTVTGMADDVVCVGDVFRIGDAVFEVTQPRVTCFKVGLALREPRMPSLLYRAGRPGFYLRVLEEGEVAAEDAIEKLSSGPGEMTVREISALLYQPGHDRVRVQRALEIPALPEAWRTSFQALLEQGEAGATGNHGLTRAAPPPAWQGFRKFRVSAIDTETADVRSFWLEAVDGGSLPPFRPGVSVSIRIARPEPQPALLRSYSLSAPHDARRYRISVKRVSDGGASAYLHDHVSEGQIVELAAPRGSFVLDVDGITPLVLLSAGIGITPLLAMLAELARADSPRAIWWLHGARNGAELAFASDVRAMAAKLPKMQSLICLSRPGDGDRLGRDFDRAGRADLESLLAMGPPPPEADYYLCGPGAFMDQMTASLLTWGIDPRRLHAEAFGPASVSPDRAPHLPDGAPGPGADVSFARSGLSVPWDEARFETLLELAEACDVPVDWSCRAGVCHRCESALVDGDVSYIADPLDEPAAGNVLLCSACPVGPVTLDL
jgi:ferredoxin-NADP reductase/MOSC domain-containing protein YiiM